jgi:hypothetical protein
MHRLPWQKVVSVFVRFRAPLQCRLLFDTKGIIKTHQHLQMAHRLCTFQECGSVLLDFDKPSRFCSPNRCPRWKTLFRVSSGLGYFFLNIIVILHAAFTPLNLLCFHQGKITIYMYSSKGSRALYWSAELYPKWNLDKSSAVTSQLNFHPHCNVLLNHQKPWDFMTNTAPIPP